LLIINLLEKGINEDDHGLVVGGLSELELLWIKNNEFD